MSAFLLFTTHDKGLVLYEKVQKFRPDFKSLHKCEEGALILVLTLSRHRVSAVKNFCSNFCTVSFLLVKGVNKPYELYLSLTTPPFEEVTRNKPSPLHKEDFQDENLPDPGVNWKMVGEFASVNNLDDPYIIMGYYLEFSDPYTDCEKCKAKKNKNHYAYHEQHYENAMLFYESKQQKVIAQHAADMTIAKVRLTMQEATRDELLQMRFDHMMERLRDLTEDDYYYYFAGVTWYKELFPDIDQKLIRILELFTENVPKRRNVLFKGPVNTGKTSLAAAILNLVGGRALNINCPAEKLAFELGCAMDQFAVVFEDVKGQLQPEDARLPTGQGMHNLDNLRDHLDGAVKVNLERKHVNKRSQIFPPCIVTCNEYYLPKTLFARFSMFVQFHSKPALRECLEKNPMFMQRRILQDGLTLFILLIWYAPLESFVPRVQEEVKYWKDVFWKSIPPEHLCDMQTNIMAGLDPLYGIFRD